MEESDFPSVVTVDDVSELDDRYEWGEVTTMVDWPKKRFVVTRIKSSHAE